MSDKNLFLIVGLGNIGVEYNKTRHNTGFMIVDKIHNQYSFPAWKETKYAFISKNQIDDKTIILVKPTTFMNLSGNAVLSLSSFYKIPASNIIVIHDDIDLDVGKIKVKIGGSSAGHNGIKDIDSKIGREYKRIRIGVGHPRNTNPEISVADWVLGKFSAQDLSSIEEATNIIVNDLSKIFA